MKVAFDTSSLINITKFDDNTTQLVEYLQKVEGLKIIINERTIEEFKKNLSPRQSQNFNKLNSFIEQDDSSYFTIGISAVGGPDTIPPASYSDFGQDYSEERYTDANTEKEPEEWIWKKQGDPTIYSKAEQNKCNYLVTDDAKDFAQVAERWNTKIISTKDFFKELALPYVDPNKLPELHFLEFKNEWEEDALSEVVSFQSGGTPSKKKPEYWDGDIPWISAMSMTESGNLSPQYYITKEALQNGSKLAKKDSILLLVRGSMLYNRVPINKVNSKVAFNQDIKALSSNNLNHSFLYYLLNAKHHYLKSKVIGTGIGAGKLDTDDLRKTKIWFPQKEEQQKIADFLMTVDERIEKLERKVELLEQYKKGVMQSIFSQRVRFKDDNGNDYPEWKEKELEKIASIKTGKKDVNEGSPDGKYPFFTCSREHTYSDNYSFEGDAILIAGNADVGHCIYYSGKFEAYQRTYVLQDFTDNSRFIFLYLDNFFRKYIKTQKQIGAMTYIKLGMLKKYKLPLPSKEEQQKIADFLTAIDDKIELTNKELQQAKQFKRGLLQQMFV